MNSGFYRSASSALAQSRAVLAQTIFDSNALPLATGEQLWLQAALDGEAPGDGFEAGFKARARSVGTEVVARELGLVKWALTHNEVERRVPRSRALYWSQIQERIWQSMAMGAAAGPGCGAQAAEDFRKEVL
jgi:hypothetical protein